MLLLRDSPWLPVASSTKGRGPTFPTKPTPLAYTQPVRLPAPLPQGKATWLFRKGQAQGKERWPLLKARDLRGNMAPLFFWMPRPLVRVAHRSSAASLLLPPCLLLRWTAVRALERQP